MIKHHSFTQMPFIHSEFSNYYKLFAIGVLYIMISIHTLEPLYTVISIINHPFSKHLFSYSFILLHGAIIGSKIFKKLTEKREVKMEGKKKERETQRNKNHDCQSSLRKIVSINMLFRGDHAIRTPYSNMHQLLIPKQQQQQQQQQQHCVIVCEHFHQNALDDPTFMFRIINRIRTVCKIITQS